MKLSGILYTLIICTSCLIFIYGNSSCAQIGAISGGDKDTIPPVLISASPKLLSTDFTGNKFTLTFDEYIAEIQDAQSVVMVSPYPKNFPEINTKLKIVTVKLKDTLQPNTTYSINFGSIIKDVNEGNSIKNLTYVFSTGKTIDSLSLSGKVELAETGKADSTLLVLLYRNANDSSVQQVKPNYISFVNGDGSFTFNNLPQDSFYIYALKDGDGGKTYNSKTEIFAFADKAIWVSEKNEPVNLYAYQEEKTAKTPSGSSKPKTTTPKKLKYTIAAASQKQDLRENLVIEFNNPVKIFDSSRILLSDTNYNPITGISFLLDSNKVSIKHKWLEDASYKIIINKDAVRDSTDSTIARTDTISFNTKKESDYGNVVLRFNNIDLKKHPVLQFTQQDVVKESYPITGNEWRNKLFPPGEYEIKILYDDNNNGKWDAGNYSKKIQPEKVVTLPKKFSVKENWDNESDINL